MGKSSNRLYFTVLNEENPDTQIEIEARMVGAYSAEVLKHAKSQAEGKKGRVVAVEYRSSTEDVIYFIEKMESYDVELFLVFAIHTNNSELVVSHLGQLDFSTEEEIRKIIEGYRSAA